MNPNHFTLTKLKFFKLTKSKFVDRHELSRLNLRDLTRDIILSNSNKKITKYVIFEKSGLNKVRNNFWHNFNTYIKNLFFFNFKITFCSFKETYLDCGRKLEHLEKSIRHSRFRNHIFPRTSWFVFETSHQPQFYHDPTRVNRFREKVSVLLFCSGAAISPPPPLHLPDRGGERAPISLAPLSSFVLSREWQAGWLFPRYDH